MVRIMEKTSKIFLIGFLIMVFIFLWAINDILIISGSLDGINGSNLNSFWWQYLIGMLIAGFITYLVIFEFPRAFPKIYTKETKLQKQHIKDVSNDLMFAVFFLGFLFYGLPVQFRASTDPILQYYSFYLYFLIIGMAYIILVKIEKIFRIMKIGEKERIKARLFELGSMKEYGKILITVLIGFLVIYIIAFLFPLNQGQMHGLFTPEGRDLIVFEICASIPAEELVFRGLAMVIFINIIKEIIFDVKQIPESHRENPEYHRIEEWASFVAILITSILFGLYHVPRYGMLFWTIFYLTILGIVLGVASYKHSIFASFLLHVANNVSAEKDANFMPILINPYFYLIIGLSILAIVALVSYFHNKPNRIKNS